MNYSIRADEAILSAADIHEKFRGDPATTIKKLNKKGVFEILHGGLEPELKYIRLGDLKPLESQRFTKASWVEKRLTKRGGLDMWAFGALDVCHDNGINWIWNGCGRFSLAKLYAIDTLGKENADNFLVPCLVIKGLKEEAAFYFGYSQDEGRRTLSKEILFLNRHYSSDPTAIVEAQQLSYLGLHVCGDSDKAVPEYPAKDSINISYRAFSEGLLIADPKDKNNALKIMRQARDMIATAWGNSLKNDVKINQDIFWAVIFFLRLYPEARFNGVNTALQGFLTAIATLTDQNKIDWKFKGLSGNKGIAPQLAYGLLKAFKATKFCKPHISKPLTYKRLENYVELTEEDQLQADSE